MTRRSSNDVAKDDGDHGDDVEISKMTKRRVGMEMRKEKRNRSTEDKVPWNPRMRSAARQPFNPSPPNLVVLASSRSRRRVPLRLCSLLPKHGYSRI